jgi:hypothetical protein
MLVGIYTTYKMASFGSDRVRAMPMNFSPKCGQSSRHIHINQTIRNMSTNACLPAKKLIATLRGRKSAIDAGFHATKDNNNVRKASKTLKKQ